MATKVEIAAYRERSRKITLGPMQGEIAEIAEGQINKSKVLENQYAQEQMFKKPRPKSAFYDKFARPSSGAHGVYSKKQKEL